jgi:signal transduction histidine kinase
MRIRPRLSAARQNMILALVVTVALIAYTWAVTGPKPGSAVGTCLVVVMGTGIWWRRRAPVAAGVAIAGAGGLYELVVEPAGVVFLAPLLLAFYSIGAYAPLPRAIVGLAVALAISFLGFLGDSRSLAEWLENVVFAGFIAGSVWAGGVAVRVSRTRTVQLTNLAAQLEREREEKAQLAAAAERARIARELHDVVAHSISVIAVQAGAGRHALQADPQRTQEAFRAIEATARQALVEMRHLLGLLREGGEPASAPLPGMENHAQLIEQAEGAGLIVEIDVEGEERDLPVGVDLAAYRILQEALTNVRKHAPGSHAAVHIRYGVDEIEIEVRDDGRGAETRDGGQRDGYGLIGMRERVALYGGQLDVGPLPGSGFRIKARLPLAQDLA